MGWFDNFEIVLDVEDLGFGHSERHGFPISDVREEIVISNIIPPSKPVFDESVTGNMNLIFWYEGNPWVLSFHVKDGKVDEIYDWFEYTGDLECT